MKRFGFMRNFGDTSGVIKLPANAGKELINVLVRES